METNAILRELLYRAYKATTTDEMLRTIRVMCSPEDVAIVEKEIADESKSE
ncbi:hypothetical protein AGMMS49975_03140 [Clostridia bacterium]|nr:hypothetical protein AGMMS49975_03140 [Clostridia bacterium]